MIKYIIKRLLTYIPVIIGVAVVIFTIMHFTPGDPVAIILGEHYTAEQHAEKTAELGFDQPYIIQLLSFLKKTFIDLDFGKSYMNNVSVTKLLMQRLPRTATIAALCMLMQIVVAIPLGVTAAVHQGGFLDNLCIVLAMLAISVPSFWIAMILVLIFANYLGWLPSFGITHWYSYILPVAANSLMGIGGIARQTRSMMLEVIRSDYMVTAKSKGISRRKLFYSHALPNALIPVITDIGSHFGRAIGGTVVIETVFSIPGVGLLMKDAISNRDYPIVLGGVTLLAVIFCLVILIMDIVYAFVDPRIKARYENQQKKRMHKTKREVAVNA